MSQLDELRKKLMKKAGEAGTTRNALELVPEFGITNVRILPAKNPEDLFYHTHSYHYLPTDGGKYLYTKRQFQVGNKLMQDPIDEAVAQWYRLGKINKDNLMLKIAGTLKRKRHFFFNVILLDETDPEKKYRILVDRSNDGKLARIICTTMGIPFFRDVEDNWVDKTSLDIDEEKDYFDLIDFEKGHDFRIKKVQDGDNTWDISYADSFPLKKARALTQEERDLYAKSLDLRDYVQYEENYNVIKAELEAFIASIENDNDVAISIGGSAKPTSSVVEEDEEIEETNDVNAKVVLPSKKKDKQKVSVEELDEMLNELDDDEE